MVAVVPLSPNQDATRPDALFMLLHGQLWVDSATVRKKPRQPAGPATNREARTTPAAPATAPATSRRSRHPTRKTAAPIAKFGLMESRVTVRRAPPMKLRPRLQAACASASPRASRPLHCPWIASTYVPAPAAPASAAARRLSRGVRGCHRALRDAMT